MNRTIRLEETPCRIVSLVPSQTELLHALGLEDEVVGITKFCIHPEEWYGGKKRVGGTKSVKSDVVKSLNPDLIIGNKEENQKENIEELESIAPIWMSDIFDLSDALEMLEAIGEVTGKQKKAQEIKEQILCEFDKLSSFVKNASTTGKKAAYFIWTNPDMAAGKNTFIDEMLSACGLINATNEERYPELFGEEELVDYVLLSSEPFPFKKKHMEYFKKMYPNAKVVLVDGEMFSWYGSRLLEAPNYFIQLLKELV